MFEVIFFIGIYACFLKALKEICGFDYEVVAAMQVTAVVLGAIAFVGLLVGLILSF